MRLHRTLVFGVSLLAWRLIRLVRRYSAPNAALCFEMSAVPDRHDALNASSRLCGRVPVQVIAATRNASAVSLRVSQCVERLPNLSASGRSDQSNPSRFGPAE